MQGGRPVLRAGFACLRACFTGAPRMSVSPPSCPAQAGHPVLTDDVVGIPRSFVSAGSAGLPACAGNDEACMVCYRHPAEPKQSAGTINPPAPWEECNETLVRV